MIGDAYRKVVDLEKRETREIAKGYNTRDTWNIINKFAIERRKFNDFEFLVDSILDQPGFRVDVTPEYFETRLRSVGTSIIIRNNLSTNFRDLTESTIREQLFYALENEGVFVQSEYG
jgi:hypothetical protein